MNTLENYRAVLDAVRTNNHQLVTEFAQRGFDLNTMYPRATGVRTDGFVAIPLLYAATDPTMIVTMVQLGANINLIGDEGLTTLHRVMVSRLPNAEIVRTIVKMGADVSLATHHGMTALDTALHRGPLIRDSVNPNAAAIADNILLNVAALRDEVMTRQKDEARMASQAAFAMGLHPRLGEGSVIQLLEKEVMRVVLEFVE